MTHLFEGRWHLGDTCREQSPQHGVDRHVFVAQREGEGLGHAVVRRDEGVGGGREGRQRKVGARL